MAGRRRPKAEVPEAVAHPDWPDLLDQMLTVEGSLGNTYRRLWQYSTGNCAFLMMQGCPIEPVATYAGWQAVQRQVTQKGAYYIQRPYMQKTGETDPKTGEDKTIPRFTLVKCIFPISMTEGEPLPDLELPEWSKQRALAALSIREVAFESFESNRQGHSFGRDIAVNQTAVFPEKTFAHECGHVLLGHTTEDSYDDYLQHRGMKELGAEAVAHLVTTELGLMRPEMASVSRAYVQSWAAGEKPTDGDVRAIFKAADQLVSAGRAPVEEEV